MVTQSTFSGSRLDDYGLLLRRKGVCGTAVRTRRTPLVPDVHEFPVPLACESASGSEILVPVMRDGTGRGVLDVDKPEKSRFDSMGQLRRERLAGALVPLWPQAGKENSK
jgi:putative methionine-R-sulfoxide reductase with GAF domain